MFSYPDIAVFDLDYTIWPCFCDTHLTPPFTQVKSSNGEVRTLIDSSGHKLSFYKDVSKIFQDLKKHNVKLISASRTWSPDIAKTLLTNFKVEDNGEIVSLITYFDSLQWGDISKINHIREGLVELFGIENPNGLDICLFDDELRNRDVENFGIKYVHVKDSKKGITWDLYKSYLTRL